MALTSIALQFRPKHRRTRSPSFIQFFSFSTADSNNDEDENITSSPPPPPPQSQSSFSSYFSDVKASLKQNPPHHQHRQLRNPFPLSSTLPSAQPPTKALSIEAIRAKLSEYRRRSAPPRPDDKSFPPHPPSSQQHISFQDLYKRNVISKGQDSSNEASKGDGLSFAAMRESLHQLRSNVANNQVNNNDRMSLSGFKETLKLRPVNPNARDSTVVIGGTDKITGSVFAKEMMEKKEGQSPAMKTEFVKVYDYKELGEKLKKLRPEAKRGNWFSLGELNERLMKLREMEEKEAESFIGGIPYIDLRQSLMKMRIVDNEKTKKQTIQRLDILGQLGGTPNFMLSPPKEHLVEKYFHPDNMSSSEKMKLELEKVRDEFKMSESDCGSARVQVAQLTTKIKHLSTALHKKDKHSRKGLQGMVQKRKKLLKYLRRTDWDSYCLVLSKLGLRDNPDFKILTYPKKNT